MKIKKFFAALMAAVCMLSLPACGAKQSGGGRTLILNYSKAFPAGTMLVMREEGYLEKYLPEDVTIEWTGLTSAPEMRDAIVSGATNIANFSLSAFIIGIENGLPLQAISYASPSPCNLYTNVEGIHSMEELPDDCKVTVNALSSTLHISFLAQCKKDTGSYTTFDNNLVPTPNLEAAAALAEGSVDASILSFPTMLKTEEMDDVYMLEDFSDVINEYNIGEVFAVNKTFYDENPDIIEAFKKAKQDARNLYATNPERFAEIMAEDYGVDTQVVLEQLKKFPPTDQLNGYDKQAELLYEANILEKEPKKFADLPNYEDLVQLRD